MSEIKTYYLTREGEHETHICLFEYDDRNNPLELIEKSAYDKLKAENDSLRIELGKPYDKVDRLFESNKKLHQDLEDLKIVNQALSKKSLEVGRELETLRELNEHLEATVKERDYMVRHHLNKRNKVEQDLEDAKELIRSLEKVLIDINEEELNAQRPGGGYSKSARLSHEALNLIKQKR